METNFETLNLEKLETLKSVVYLLEKRSDNDLINNFHGFCFRIMAFSQRK